MIYKEDWDKSKQRFSAFWQSEVIDRCCCSITAPRGKPLFPAPSLRAPRNLEQQWTDPEYRMEQALHYFNTTFFGGDAYPMFWNNLGPGVAAAYIGAGYRLAEDTIWFDSEPPIKDWSMREPVLMDWDSPMWKTTWAMTELFCKNARDDYLVGITDLGGSVDIAASLRGSDVLLYDLYDHPDEIKLLVTEVDTAWKLAYDRLQALMSQYVHGTSAWMGLWCAERWYPLQCDFSAMISRSMFDAFVKPALALEASWFDRAVYHLDGPGQICHLESILEINDICGIQCVPGSMYQQSTGECHPSFVNDLWIPVLKKIQSAGRNLIINEVHPTELNNLMEQLSPNGLFVSMNTKTEDEARSLIKRIEKWR